MLLYNFIMNYDNLYIISDLHLEHKNIIKYCNRPYDMNSIESIEQMNEDILAEFDKLPENSIIINCGDVSLNSKLTFDKLASWVSRMKQNNKKLWLILGNHDREMHRKAKYFKNAFTDAVELFETVGFDKVFESPILLGNKYLLSHEPVYLNPGNNLINFYGHTHDTCVDENYFNHECDNYAMMKRVKENPELTKQTNLDIDTEKLSRTDLIVDTKNYFNVCWDANHKILKYTDILHKLSK